MLIENMFARRETELIFARLDDHDMVPPRAVWLSPFIMTITGIAFGLAFFLFEYTYGVVATLAAVEDDRPNPYILLDEGSMNFEYEGPSRAKPVTGGLWSAITFLRARGGMRECFRGIRMFMIVATADTVFRFMIIPLVSSHLRSAFVTISVYFIASMPWAAWHMAWVHLAIADQSPRRPYRRMLSFRHWPKVAPAAALFYFTSWVSGYLPIAVSDIAGWTVGISRKFQDGEPLGMMVLAFLCRFSGVLLCLPARVIFIRVAASMLPEKDEPIVPFDRAFGGKVDPKVSGGECLGIRDAWSTFRGPARISFVKIVLAGIGIQAVIAAVGAALMLCEFYVITI